MLLERDAAAHSIAAAISTAISIQSTSFAQAYTATTATNVTFPSSTIDSRARTVSQPPHHLHAPRHWQVRKRSISRPYIRSKNRCITPFRAFVTLVIAGSIETFDAPAFKAALAELLADFS